MPIDVVKQNGLLDRYVSDSGVTGHVAATDRAQTHDVDLGARLHSAEIFEVQRHRWWTLRSESLEVLPTGWCCEDTGCWSGMPSASAGWRRRSLPESGSTYRRVPGESGARTHTQER